MGSRDVYEAKCANKAAKQLATRCCETTGLFAATALFSLFLVKARAGAKPQKGPRKDGRSL